jgi:hypothetical protein
MAENFTQKFMNKSYKEHRENVLLEREKALMPETQNFVELEIKMRRLSRDLQSATNRTQVARVELIRAKSVNYEANDFDAGEARLRLQSACRIELFNRRAIQENIEEQIRFLASYRYGNRPVERFHRVFVRACPGPDCKGFLSTAWKCGICDKTTCKECHEIKTGDDHTCDPNNVETARMLDRDSRPCPKCACMIFKIDGCDQMWCTQCHTAFSWRHGTIVTSIIHNPHYYDYMRTNGGLPRNPLDRPCGGMPEWPVVRSLGISHAVYRLPLHADLVLRPFYDRRDFDPNHNRELRIKYMLNEIDSDKFKTLIQRDEKSRQKNNDVYNVLEMFSTVITDLLQTFVTERNMVAFNAELEELRVYVNQSMTSVSKNYSNCRVPRIREDLSWDM